MFKKITGVRVEGPRKFVVTLYVLLGFCVYERMIDLQLIERALVTAR